MVGLLEGLQQEVWETHDGENLDKTKLYVVLRIL